MSGELRTSASGVPRSPSTAYTRDPGARSKGTERRIRFSARKSAPPDADAFSVSAWITVGQGPRVASASPKRRRKAAGTISSANPRDARIAHGPPPVSYTHLRAHETRHDLVCRL